MQVSPNDLIESLGGATQVAARIGATPGSVRAWKFKNKLPRKAWPELIAAYPHLTLDALKQVEKRSGRAEAPQASAA